MKNALLCVILIALNGTLFGQRTSQFYVPQQCFDQQSYLTYLISQLNACDDVIDVAFELSGPVITNMMNNDCTIKSVDIVTYQDGEQRISFTTTTETTLAIFNLPSNVQYIDFTLEAKDRMGTVVFSAPIRHTVRKTGDIVVSESMMELLFDMGHTTGGGSPAGPKGDVFTYFCGKRVSMVALLAFYQDFLGLSEYHICRFKVLFAMHGLDYQSTQMVEWTGIYCTLLEAFWESYVSSASGGGGDDDDDDDDEEDCECKVINSSVFVNHSIGEATGTPLEDCPDVSITEGNKVWSHEGTLPNTDGENNWLVSKWAYMGAAKSLYTISHHFEGGDQDSDMSATLPAAILKSSLTFAMKCFEPHNAAISDDCDCEKTITTAGRYNSSVSGMAGTDGGFLTSGNGSVNSCMEDFAFFTRFSREGFEMVEMGAAISCVQCESSDSTNFLTDVGTLAGEIEGIVPTFLDTFSLSNIDDYFLGAGQVVDLIGNFISNLETCGDFQDTSYVLFNTTDTYTLSPQNDYVSYIVTSRATSRTDFKNDEAWSELHLISNYYLAAGLESDGDSTCCNEMVGAYSIGHLGEFTESQLATVSGDDVDFEGFEFEINDPKKNGSWLEDGGLYQQSLITLEHLQADVALVFAAINPNFLKDVFGLDCGPGCTVTMDCYYDCGFWGECHEVDVIGLVADLPEGSETTTQERSGGIEVNGAGLAFQSFQPTQEVKIFPNPISEGYELAIQYGKAEKYTHLYIFNLAGQLLYDQALDTEGNNWSIDSDYLTNGVNMVMITKEDGSIYVDRIIKE